MTAVLKPLALGTLLYGWAVALGWSVVLTIRALQDVLAADAINSFPFLAAAQTMVTVALVWMGAAALAALVLAVREKRS